jgi:hypothetical protein
MHKRNLWVWAELGDYVNTTYPGAWARARIIDQQIDQLYVSLITFRWLI